MRRLLALLVVLLLSTCAGTLLAQESGRAGDQYRKSPFAMEGHLAPAGGPLGIVGVALDVAPIPQLSLAAGIGAGSYSTQWAAAVRPRIPLTNRVALGFSAVYSRGDYKTFRIALAESIGTFVFRDCSWVSGDFGPEWRFSGGGLVRLYFGASHLVSSKEPILQEGETGNLDQDTNRWPTLLYVGTALGGHFGI